MSSGTIVHIYSDDRVSSAGKLRLGHRCADIRLQSSRTRLHLRARGIRRQGGPEAQEIPDADQSWIRAQSVGYKVPSGLHHGIDSCEGYERST